MNMKPLNQDNFKMNIIEDLGTIKSKNTNRKERFAIFECSRCKKHTKKNIYNAKKTSLCPECSKADQQQKVIKKPIPSNYKMKLIKDLGMNIAKNGKKYHTAIFECTKCKNHFNVRIHGKQITEQLVCKECTLNPEQTCYHPLYAIWNGIRQRCYNPKRKDYYNYGEKNITMCDLWKDDVKAFIKWCEDNGWNKTLVIDKDIKCKELNINPKIYAPHTISFITNQQNTEFSHGKKVIQLSLNNEFIKEYKSVVYASLQTNTSKTSIAKVCRGKQKTANNYKWKYV